MLNKETIIIYSKKIQIFIKNTLNLIKSSIKFIINWWVLFISILFIYLISLFIETCSTFQDPFSIYCYHLISVHHHIMWYIFLILVLVYWCLYKIIKDSNWVWFNRLNENSWIFSIFISGFYLHMFYRFCVTFLYCFFILLKDSFRDLLKMHLDYNIINKFDYYLIKLNNFLFKGFNNEIKKFNKLNNHLLFDIDGKIFLNEEINLLSDLNNFSDYYSNILLKEYFMYFYNSIILPIKQSIHLFVMRIRLLLIKWASFDIFSFKKIKTFLPVLKKYRPTEATYFYNSEFVSFLTYHYTANSFFYNNKPIMFNLRYRQYKGLGYNYNLGLTNVLSLGLGLTIKPEIINYPKNNLNDSVFLDTFFESQNFKHNTAFEFIWAFFPTYIILSVLFPSLYLLYSLDEDLDPMFTIKVIGHQWYWSYEFNNWVEFNKDKFVFVNFNFDSNIIDTDSLAYGTKRILEVDNRLIVPMGVTLRFLITSGDVLHSWAVPSLGIKLDAVPGRLNQFIVYISSPGVYYGQCSEICGAAHGFMPIVVHAVPYNNFLNWIKESF